MAFARVAARCAIAHAGDQNANAAFEVATAGVQCVMLRRASFIAGSPNVAATLPNGAADCRQSIVDRADATVDCAAVTVGCAVEAAVRSRVNAAVSLTEQTPSSAIGSCCRQGARF
jgi:hypothetical protein